MNEKPKDEQQTEEVVVKENAITRAEAYRLLSYLSYNKAQREAMSMKVTYSDDKMSGWYDSYVNAVHKMGLIEEAVTISPKEALTYGACKELMDQLMIHNPNFQGIYNGLTIDFTKADEQMLIPEFLELYKAILLTYEKDMAPVKEETLFVLGEEEKEEGLGRMVTDIGKFYYADAKSYEGFINADEKNKVSKTQKEFLEQYIDQGITGMVCGQELIYVTSILKQRVVLHNVWIIQGKDKKVETFVGDINKTFDAKFPLSTEIDNVIGDIAMEGKQIVQISVKPDIIHGKVLRSGDDFIEIEDYGKIPLDTNYQIYKVYGELSLEPTKSILVGYETTDFVVSDGKISAALIKESIKAENIRVLLRNNNFQDIYHETVKLTATTDFTVHYSDKDVKHAEGEVVELKPGDEMLSNGRVRIEPVSENGKIEMLSLERSDGNPKYRGSIEISEDENGLLVINELPLEEYLYAVIPSEMPTFYGDEALKVQAICARSYAYRHLLANSLNAYGAHVDDSVSYQVYNNISENESSILAVKDTYGKVIEYEGDVITAYYFSTSSGHTTAIEEVFANGTETPYLTGRLMVQEGDGAGTVSTQETGNRYEDLSEEDTFASFLSDEELITYDSEFEWYRWKVSMSAEDISNMIDKKVKARYNVNPDLILTLAENEEGKEVYESQPIETIGTVKNLEVAKREKSGVISELKIVGTKATILVKTEYNIRTILAPTNNTVIRKDGSEIKNLSLLPSAFFIIDAKKEDKKLTSVTLSGGGYGHGLGMSQNGVKGMADLGIQYEDIITYFYQGTELGFIYE
jgi:stage II sporulation protein D